MTFAQHSIFQFCVSVYFFLELSICVQCALLPPLELSGRVCVCVSACLRLASELILLFAITATYNNM